MGGRGSSSASAGNTRGGMSFDDYLDQYGDSIQFYRSEQAEALADKGLAPSSFQLFMDENNDYQSPDVMDDKDFNKYVKENGLEVINRGVHDVGDSLSATEIHEAFMADGPYYIGFGVYGNGMYFGSERTAITYATEDGQKGATIRAALKTGSKTIEYNKLVDMFQASPYNSKAKYYDSNVISAYARSLGYDAIKADTRHDGIYTNVLNRGALVISKKITKRTPPRWD